MPTGWRRCTATPRSPAIWGGTKDRVKTEEMLTSRCLQYYDGHPGLGIWMVMAWFERDSRDWLAECGSM